MSSSTLTAKRRIITTIAALIGPGGGSAFGQADPHAAGAVPPSYVPAELLESVSVYRAFNMRELPNFLIHRGRYTEALQAARALTATVYPQSRSVGYSLAGQALLWLGRRDEATRELEAAKRAWRDADPDLPELARIAEAGIAGTASTGKRAPK